VMVSTGDSGSAGCDNDNTEAFASFGQAVNGFASTPYDVAVGGTDFYYPNYATLQSELNGGTLKLDSFSSYWNTTATQLPAVSLKGYFAEQPWNNSQFGLNIYDVLSLSGDTSSTIAGGSGGASNCAVGSGATSSGGWATCTSGYAKPTWQTGTGVPSDGVRDIPDVSLFASNGTNFSYYALCAVDGDCQTPTGANLVQISGVGGTSASAPSFAGIMALVNQKYGRQGQADFVLYPLRAQYPAAFHDVTVGSNAVPCDYGDSTPDCIAGSGTVLVTLTDSNGNPYYVTEGEIGSGSTPEYNAGVGYDLASGLGTVDANVLVTDWSKVSFASTQTTLTPSSTSFTHGTAISVTGTVTAASGTPTGNVALMTDSTEPVTQGITSFPLVSGSFDVTGINTLPGGTYNVWGQYGGDAQNGLSTSTKTQITVSPETSGMFFNVISPSGTIPTGTTSIDYGTQLMLSAQVAPSTQVSALQSCQSTTGATCPVFTTPTGTIAFTDNGKALNTALINAEGDAEYNAPFTVGSHSVMASFAGDKSYSSTTSSPISFTVAMDTPVLNISAANTGYDQQTGQNVIINGQTTVFNVQVENNAQVNSTSYALTPVAPPTGKVTVSSSPSGISGTATLSPAVDPSTSALTGVGTITALASLSAGTYSVTVAYGGDANYNATSFVFTLPVVSNSNGEPSTTTATTSGSISPTTNVTVTGTVTGVSKYGPPGYPVSTNPGYILVYTSGNYINEVLVTPCTTSGCDTSSFSFTLNSQSLSQGTNYITLQYTGDNTYYSSAAQPITINNPLSDFTLIPQTTIVPVTAGTPATDTINLASANGLSGAVSLTCSAATGVTCQIASPVTLASGGSGTAALTLNAPVTTTNGPYNVLVTGADSTGKYIHTLGIQAVVSGGGGQPTTVSLAPGSLTFPSTSVGATAASQSIQLSNTGKSALTISGVSITGTNASSFSQTNNCGTSVAVGGSCLISVSFKPASSGPLSATVSVADNGAGSPQTAALSGTGAAPAPFASLSPTSLNFSSTPMGTSAATQTITLSNTGNASLTGVTISITGANASSFSQTNKCGTSVAANGSCAITVTFKPAATGALSASVSVSDNASGSPQTAGLSGTGAPAPAPVVNLSTNSATFPGTPVSTAAPTQQITLSNTGNASLTGVAISISGTNASSFSQTNKCGTSVAANGSCVITVTFKPTAAGTLTAKLNVADNAAGSPQQVTLSGTGTAPAVSLSGATLTFPGTLVNTSATPQQITLSNTGNGTLTLTGTAITITGTNASAFSETNNCGASVAAGSNCAITVAFKPATTGTLSASLNIADNASGSPQKVTLSGSGTAPTVKLSATTLTFSGTPVGSAAATQKITLQNTGTAPLSLGGTGQGIGITGTNATSYSQQNTCGSSVAASGSCTITVTFQPASTGTLTAKVSVADNATGSPQTVTLTGTGTAPAVSLSPASLTFASTSVGTSATAQKITLKNTGTGTLTLSGISITGTNSSSFSQTNTCGATVAASGTCVITVGFKPTAKGSLTASVSVADSAANSPQTAGLTGTGK